MALFAKRNQATPPSQPWEPRFEPASARAIVLSLAQCPAYSDQQVRDAVAALVRASDGPTDPMVVIENIRNDPQITQRPWLWLAAVQREANQSGDHHLSAAALWWAGYFTSFIATRAERPIDLWDDIKLDLIRVDVKRQILATGQASATALPPEFVIAGDESGTMTAATLNETAPTLLGL